MARRGALTVEVTVSSFSSYVAFLEGYARALVGRGNAAGTGAAWLRDAIRSARAEVRYAPDDVAARRLTVSFPRRPQPIATSRGWRRRSSRSRPGSPRPGKRQVIVALDEFQADRRASTAARSSTRCAPPSSISAHVGLRVRRVRAEPDGADARRRSGRSTRPARSCGSRRFRPTSSRRSSTPASPRRDSKPEPGLGAAIVDLAGNLPYDVQRLAHETWDEVRASGRRRATLDDLHQALKRLLAEQQTHVRGRLAAADARPACRAPRGRARGRPRAAVGRRPRRGIVSAARRRCRPRSPRCPGTT